MSSNMKFGMRSSELRTTHLKSGYIPQSKGFTLLEVLLAMAILAIMLTTVYMSFSTAGANVERAQAAREETDLARTLMTRLTADITNAYVKPGMNVPTVFSGKKEELTGEGNDEKIRHDSLDLTTLTNWRRPDSKESDLWEVGYFFKEKLDGDGFVLMRREKRELSKDLPALEGGDEYELTDRVESLQFRYFDGIKWIEEWPRTLNSTPKSVEIVVTLDSGSVYTTKVDVGNS